MHFDQLDGIFPEDISKVLYENHLDVSLVSQYICIDRWSGSCTLDWNHKDRRIRQGYTTQGRIDGKTDAWKDQDRQCDATRLHSTTARPAAAMS